MPKRSEKAGNRHFVATSLTAGKIRAQALYQDLFCARGDMEKRIKDCQLDLVADGTSACTLSRK